MFENARNSELRGKFTITNSNITMFSLRTISFFFLLSIVGLANADERLSFQLERLNGSKIEQVSEQNWPDKYLLIAIGFVSCPDICPTTLLQFSKAMHHLQQQPQSADKVQPLFITIDPQRDSLKDLTKYTAHFDSSVVALRATDYAKLDNIIDQLKAGYGYSLDGKPLVPPNLPEGYTVMHTTYMYLYSPNRELVDVFPYDMDGKELAKRIAAALTTADNKE